MNEILIVGAGPTGLVLAALLIKYGINVVLIDKALGPSPFSKALGIQARTLEIFEKMGIVEPFLKEGMIAKQIFFHQNQEKIAIPLIGIDSFYPFILILSQAETERILSDHLHSLGGKILWNHRFVQFEDNATLLQTPVGLEKKEFSYVIGCDGAHSTVRHALHIDFVGHKLKETFYLADVKMEQPIREKGPHVFFDSEGICVMLPFKEENLCRLIFPENQSSYQSRKQKFPIVSELWNSEFTVHRRIATTFRKMNVLLAGDAAHVHSPAGGQGMNMSIQDAFNLAWKLALVLKNSASPSLLNTYEIERRPIAIKVLKGTTWATRIVVFFHRMRSTILFRAFSWTLGRKWIMKKMGKTISEIAIRYTNSSIIMGFKTGMRAPDLIMEDGKRLFELVKSDKHILLLFDKIEIDSTDFFDVFIIHDQNVKRRYEATAKTMVMIRPDGYIGLRSRRFSSKKLEKYINKILHYC